MRNSIQADVARVAAPRDRKLFRSLLLLGAVTCVTMSVLRIEPSISSIAALITRGGERVVNPLLLQVRRHTSW